MLAIVYTTRQVKINELMKNVDELNSYISLLSVLIIQLRVTNFNKLKFFFCNFCSAISKKAIKVGGVGGGLLVEWDTYQVNDKGQAHCIVLDKQGSDVR